jgi:hypothetical protein
MKLHRKPSRQRKQSQDAHWRLRQLGFEEAGLRCYQNGAYRIEFTGDDWTITDRKTERTVSALPSLGMVVKWIENQEIKNL